jgi:hypothetical protein
MYLPEIGKKGKFWEVGVGDWQSIQDSFFFFFEFADEQVLRKGWRPAFLESFSLKLRNDTKMLPRLKSFFFFIVASIVYGCNQTRRELSLAKTL